MDETRNEIVLKDNSEGEKNESEKQKEKKSFPGVNLYVKNLDDSFTDEKLRDVFSKFGVIISTKMMFEGSRPKGFGFVCFSTKEEAQLAVTQLNGRIVGSKPLYVTYAQKKEDRKAFLEKKYKELGSGTITPNGPPPAVTVPTVKSPTLLPPTNTPAPAYYPMHNSQNIHFQYFPTGPNVMPWGNMMPVQVPQQYYPAQSQTLIQQPSHQFENGVAHPNVVAPTMIWTNNNNYTFAQQANSTVPHPAVYNTGRVMPNRQNFHQQKAFDQKQPNQQAYYIQ